MIEIKNIGGNPFGVCDYEVKINGRLITTFSHDRCDGLAKCLERAGKAVDRQKWIEFAKACGPPS